MALGRKTGGRRPGSPNKATAEVKELALKHGPEAIEVAARLMRGAESETARLAAANIILDRAYGRAPQAVEMSGPNGGPIQSETVTPTDEQRARALMALIARTKGKAEV
jgi:hypothetical protein